MQNVSSVLSAQDIILGTIPLGSKISVLGCFVHCHVFCLVINITSSFSISEPILCYLVSTNQLMFFFFWTHCKGGKG